MMEFCTPTWQVEPQSSQMTSPGDRSAARCLTELCKRLNGAPDPLEAISILLHAAKKAVDATEARAGIVLDDDVFTTQSITEGSPTQLRRSSVATDTRYQHLSRQPQVEIGPDGAITVPLVDDGKGVLAWFELTRAPFAAFTATEVELLEGMAAAATLALEAARMRCEHRHSSRASDEANSLLSATIESTLDGIMAVDANGDIVAYNRRFVEMWGLDDHDLTRGDSNDLLMSLLGELKDPVLFFEKVSELHWQPEAESYDVIELRSGKCFERFSRPRLSEGRPAGRVWTFHDITELKKLENQLLHTEKMEAIGTLVGGIAHDFNNIMTAVIGYTDLLMLEFSPPAPYRGFLENIHSASHRAITLVKNLLAFSKEEALPTAKLECNALLQNVAGLMDRLTGSEVDLVLKPSSTPQGALVDQGQIEQVLVNLATNARDAMPQGGTLTIDVDAVELSAQELAGHHTAKPGPYVRISFSDTGFGIDDSAKARIFDPFFTTKEVGKGSGLGLSISYGIVKRHGGLIDVASRQGEGTTFSVLLPRVELTPAPRTRPLPPKSNSAETVLLVDDDATVRDLMAAVLRRNGHRVVEADDGAAAVEAFARHRDEIAVVVMDVMMPKLDGWQAYEEMRGIRGDILALFVSGNPVETSRRELLSESGSRFLMKPVPPQLLSTTMREILNGVRTTISAAS